jgi:hypothetical protein
VERWTVTWASMAGVISGGILGLAEVVVRRWYLDDNSDWRQQVWPWTFYLLLAVVVSGVEILFLYWNALRGVGRTSALAGLGLAEGGENEVLARGLVWAAFEFPNSQEPVFGIDPYARTPRWKLRARRILYRMKVGVSSFIFRVLLRRLLGRAALRFAIPLMAIPLFAIWNAFITWRIMRQARIRSVGPLAVQELGGKLGQERKRLGKVARRMMLEAVGELIIRSQDNHPNFILLMRRMLKELEVSPDELEVDWMSNREQIRDFQEREQKALVQTLSVAAIVDGGIGGGEAQLLAQVYALCQRPFPRETLDRMRRDFLNGQGVGKVEGMWEEGE